MITPKKSVLIQLSFSSSQTFLTYTVNLFLFHLTFESLHRFSICHFLKTVSTY
ncbi:hypothetical protein CTH30272_02821 [Allocatenococcus thiocycli]|nr:hypothetical protein CTH30272_02821 [Catenococcus thiocycli]